MDDAGGRKLAGCSRLGNAVRTLSESHRRYRGINASLWNTKTLQHWV